MFFGITRCVLIAQLETLVYQFIRHVVDNIYQYIKSVYTRFRNDLELLN